MDKLLARLRQTGRTTRLVDLAAKLILEGKPPIIVAASSSDAARLLELIKAALLAAAKDKAEPLFEEVRVVIPGSVDWETLRVRGVAEDTEHLFDNGLLESRFYRLVKALHRFDEDEQEVAGTDHADATGDGEKGKGKRSKKAAE